MNTIRVLVVDDSAFMCKIISDILNKHPKIEVIDVARNGKEAVEKTIRLKPDVITLDIEMPIMDGLEALDHIMKEVPTPVVMLSSTAKASSDSTMVAIEKGAVDFVAKPGGSISLNLAEIEHILIDKVIEASKVQVSRLVRSERPAIAKPTERFKQTPHPSNSTAQYGELTKSSAKLSKSRKTFVIIGTSTGGPRALQEVLTKLPENVGAPILIVQHMPKGFTRSLAERLNNLCEITVKEAEQGETVQDNVAYIAPGGYHLKFKKEGSRYVIWLDKSEPPRKAHRPAVDVLLENASTHSELQYLTVIMTGMGYDGRDGLRTLREVESKTVAIAESEKTAVIYGMPKAVIEEQLVDEVVELGDIADSIMKTLSPRG